MQLGDWPTLKLVVVRRLLWIKPTQSADNVNGVAVQKYIDEFGNETASADGFTSLPEWSPIYLDKGELTFNTSGNLVSPSGGAQLDTVFLSGGRGALNLTIDYGETTQFSQAFAVKSQSQDGSPEGDLVGLDIGDDGLVVASYSNGSQNSLGKIVLVTFPSNEGLRQNGDSSCFHLRNQEPRPSESPVPQDMERLERVLGSDQT